MLSTLSILDFALIESQQLDFSEGLTVISGETGAGKSILIDALGLLLGKRASREYVRQGRERALVEALFSAAQNDLPETLRCDLGLEGDEIILSREVKSDGRSFARINGRLVTLDVLAEVGAKLLAIHGQNSQEEIYQEPRQRDFLDRFGDPKHQEALKSWREGVTELKTLFNELKALGLSPNERARELELLNYQIEEIETADIELGEDEKLLKKSKALAAREKIKEHLLDVEALFSGASDAGVQALLQRALASLELPAKYSKKLAAMRDDVLHMSENAREFGYEINSYLETIETDDEALSMIQERLDELNDLKRKYGDSLDEVLALGERFKKRRDELLNSETRFKTLQEESQRLQELLDLKAKRLTAERQRSAAMLDEQMSQSLRELNLPDAVFKVVFKEEEHRNRFSLKGRDTIAFYFSANLGEPLKPLAKVASGGEASRLILALKSLLADQEDIGVLIFDEIDQGIGGKTSEKIASRLQRLGMKHQVLCVSHSATVAAAAQNHYLIEKKFQNQRTITEVHLLDHPARQREVARLLAGDVGKDQSMKLSEALLNEQNERFLALKKFKNTEGNR